MLRAVHKKGKEERKDEVVWKKGDNHKRESVGKE
jgi:hypothetical protein